MATKAVAQIENQKTRFGKYQLSACAKARIVAQYDAKPKGSKAAFLAACGMGNNNQIVNYWSKSSRGDYWQNGVHFQNQFIRSFPADAADTCDASLRHEPKVQISESIPPDDVEFLGIPRFPTVPVFSFPPPVDEAQSTARIWIYVLIGFNVVQFAAHLLHWVTK